MTFRNIDGSGNNLNNASFGQAHENEIRQAPANYADGISASGNPNGPNPREISNAVFNQLGSIPDQRGLSDYVWMWGQFIDHDLSLAPVQSGDDAEQMNIEIPTGDLVYTPGSMIPFGRSIFDETTGTDPSNPRQHPNNITAWIVPGSKQVEKQAQEEGIVDVLEEAGFKLRQPGCSACLAMNDDKIPSGKYAVSTSNRNFEGRQGPGSRTLLASPLTAAAVAVTGKLIDPRELTEA